MTRALAPIDLDATTDQIEMLATYFGTGLEPAVLRLYVDALRDVPADALRAGCRRLVARSRFMPKVAEIREAVDAVAAEAHEAAQKRSREAERREARVPFTVFGRMSKNAVMHRFNGFVAEEMCECVPCWDAQVQGPPRFVPDGTDPPPICYRCQDTGTLEVRPSDDRALLGVTRCVCITNNPQLNPSTRQHPTEMGRWLHGHDLREHELAQEAFYAALRGAVDRSRMSPKEAR